MISIYKIIDIKYDIYIYKINFNNINENYIFYKTIFLLILINNLVC